MISETKATFKLGIQFVDWGAPGETYIHGFGKIGQDMLWLHPHQLWLAARERVPSKIMASLKNRFAFPDPRNPSSPIAHIDYAYHFDASLFARFLRAESEARGVTRVEGRIVEVLKDGESGFVTAVPAMPWVSDMSTGTSGSCATGHRRCPAPVYLRSLPTRARQPASRAGNGAFRCSTGSATGMSMRPT
jgi:hypothetical protein